MKKNLFNRGYYSTGNYNDYQKIFIDQGEKTAKLLIRSTQLQPGAKILDVGCGLGGVVSAFRKLGFQALGTEISPFCLKSSPVKKYLRSASATSLPFASNRFDLVICQDVLCYLSLPQLNRALKELSRVSSCFVYLEVIPKYSPNTSQRLNPDDLRNINNLFSKKTWLKLIRQSGLKPIQPLYSIKDNPDLNLLLIKD